MGEREEEVAESRREPIQEQQVQQSGEDQGPGKMMRLLHGNPSRSRAAPSRLPHDRRSCPLSLYHTLGKWGKLEDHPAKRDRKSVVEGKSVDTGGRWRAR